MIDTGKLTSRGRTFRVATGGAVLDQTLLAVATEYENSVMRKVVALTPDDLARRCAGDEPVLETTKYDGEGVFVYFEKGRESFSFNAPSGRVRLGFAALAELEKKLTSAGVSKALVRAELWLPPVGDKRRGIAEVIRVSFNGTDADLAELKLVLLDVIMLDGKDLRANQQNFRETWEKLGALAGTDSTQLSFRMEGTIIPDKEVSSVFTKKIAAGAEGVVVRRLNRFDAIKIKPFRHVDGVVIGYVEGEFEGQYGVTSLLTALTYPKKDEPELWLQAFARVGSGLTDEQRVGFLNLLHPLRVEAPLAMTDSDGRTIHFVKPQLLVEMGGEDLVSTTEKGENRTQLLSWDKATGKYTFVGLTPMPRLTFARFIRLREDKELAAGGARLEQIVTNPQRPEVRPRTVKEPRVLHRAVYVKAEMVRKLVIVENTPGEGAFSYSVFWTDFSSKRAEPLKVTSLFAANEERARKLGEKLIAENITKGFVLTVEEPARAGAAPAAKEPVPVTVAPEPTAAASGEASAELKSPPKKKAAKKAK
jgi:hypothetical protein